LNPSRLLRKPWCQALHAQSQSAAPKWSCP
jgi:hypothetical protein